MIEKYKNSLFSNTTIGIFIPMIVLSFVVFFVITLFILIPLGKQSANDLTNLIKLSATIWTETPEKSRASFRKHVQEDYRLTIELPSFELVPLTRKRHYLAFFMQKSLNNKFGRHIEFKESMSKAFKGWIWFDVVVNAETVRFGLPIERVGFKPILIFVVSMLSIFLLSLLTALFLARKISLPLTKLSKLTSSIRKGKAFQLPEPEGAKEIILLTENFRKMCIEIHQLLENRTILLAGISHDIRTPLTRLRISAELMGETVDPLTLEGFVRDIDEMETLLKQNLELAKSIDKKEKKVAIDLSQLIPQIIAPYQISYPKINWQHASPVIAEVPLNTFKRVFSNLLQNAINYGDNQQIEIELKQEESQIKISIFDGGLGIPEKERELVFRPFYRIKNSKLHKTGGSGLGLAIVKQLCYANGWQIYFYPKKQSGNEARLNIPILPSVVGK